VIHISAEAFALIDPVDLPAASTQTVFFGLAPGPVFASRIPAAGFLLV